MGWKYDKWHLKIMKDGRCVDEIPPETWTPSIVQMQAESAVAALDVQCQLEVDNVPTTKQFYCQISFVPEGKATRKFASASGRSEAHAICLAVLKAKDILTGDQ